MRRMVQGDLDMSPSPAQEHSEHEQEDAVTLLQQVQNCKLDMDNENAQRLAGLLSFACSRLFETIASLQCFWDECMFACARFHDVALLSSCTGF